MQSKSDAQLLREFAKSGAESAFTELVARHTNLVYSAALRQLESPDEAAEIAQIVFIGLARGAQGLIPRLTDDASLAGWLCRSARNISLNQRRDQYRRQSRERQAMDHYTQTSEAVPEWESLRPVLDELMSDLNESDYDALVMRFYNNQDLRSVGRALGVSDDTAQKRVSRALDRLRELFSRRGINTTTAALSIVLSANAVQSAPAGLAAAISAAIPAAGITLAATGSATVHAAKAIAMTSLQKALVTAAIIAASVAAPLMVQQREQARLRTENAALRRQMDEQTRLSAENGRLSRLLARNNGSQQLPDNQFNELLRLRNEVASLRAQTSQIGNFQAQIQKLRSAPASQPGVADITGKTLPKESWSFVGYAEPTSGFQSAFWAMNKSDAKTILNSLAPNGEIARDLAGASEEKIFKETKGELENVTAIKIEGQEVVSDDKVILTVSADGMNLPRRRFRMERVNGEWKLDGMIHENLLPGTR